MTDLLASVVLSGLWPAVKNWFFGLSDQYGVDPLVFGSISIGAIPFFWLSVAWLVRTVRQGPVRAVGLRLSVHCRRKSSSVGLRPRDRPPWVQRLFHRPHCAKEIERVETGRRSLSISPGHIPRTGNDGRGEVLIFLALSPSVRSVPI